MLNCYRRWFKCPPNLYTSWSLSEDILITISFHGMSIRLATHWWIEYPAQQTKHQIQDEPWHCYRECSYAKDVVVVNPAVPPSVALIRPVDTARVKYSTKGNRSWYRPKYSKEHRLHSQSQRSLLISNSPACLHETIMIQWCLQSTLY